LTSPQSFPDAFQHSATKALVSDLRGEFNLHHLGKRFQRSAVAVPEIGSNRVGQAQGGFAHRLSSWL
jgi:hypothetical protein